MEDLERHKQEPKDLGPQNIEDEILIRVFLARLDTVSQTTKDTLLAQKNINQKFAGQKDDFGFRLGGNGPLERRG